jgi:hypothetical protein
VNARAKQVVLNVSLLLGISLVLLVTFELLGRYWLFADRLDMVHDVDHRMKPEWEGINTDGIRSDLDADAFSPEAFNILLLGDSFVLGLYLEDDQTIPAQLERLIRERRPGLDVHVLNFGWISASPLLSYRQLVDIGAKYEPDLVVECVDMTDFQDDMKYARFLDRRGIYDLVPVVPVTFLTLRKVISFIRPLDGLHLALYGFPAPRFFPVRAPLEETRRFLEPLRANVDAMAAFSRDSLGVPFALCVFPRSFQYSERESPQNWEAGEYEVMGEYAHEPFRYFESIRDETPYPIYSLLPDFLATPVFPTCFPDDPHWTPAGANVAAKAIYHYLSRDGLLDPVGPEAPLR